MSSLFCGANPDVQYSKFDSHGKWLTFQNMENINKVWCVVREEVTSGRLGAVAAKCSTLFYNPLVHGTGPCTTGRISVFTSKEACIEVGTRFIRLEGVQHDIKYKTNEATREERFAHTPRRNGPITSKTLYWNGGEPSETQTGMECPPPARNDKDDYDPASDPWKIHIVHGTGDPEHQHGKWIIKGTYTRADHDNISALFHRFKKKLEEGEVPAIRMECPSQPRNTTDPEIHVFTAEANMTLIGKQLIDTVKHDNIRYVIGGGSFRDDVKTLYWNNGIPSYEDSSRARDHQGILGNWRS